MQGEESRRPARCGARRRSAKPESAPSDWHPSAAAALGAPPWRGDFPPCDPRKAEYHRRIGAPNICRPHASVVGAGADEYELGALSRRRGPRRARLRGGVARVERRRPLRLLVLQKSTTNLPPYVRRSGGAGPIACMGARDLPCARLQCNWHVTRSRRYLVSCERARYRLSESARLPFDPHGHYRSSCSSHGATFAAH